MKIFLEKMLSLPDFPSASALEWYNSKLYVVGDDATHMLVLDNDYQFLEKITLFPFSEKRIPKKVKPDLEAATIIEINSEPYLLLVGSGSKDAERDVVKLLSISQNNPIQYHCNTYPTTAFFSQIRKAGVTEINIEGATTIKNQILLANRGNKTNPGSLLLTAPLQFWEAGANQISIDKLILPDTDADISGLEYHGEKDLLLFTASKEETLNAIDDGMIGDSFIGWVLHFSDKKETGEIVTDAFINLSAAHESFQGKKIESICLEAWTTQSLTVHLCADNDDGESTLFKIIIELN